MIYALASISGILGALAFPRASLWPLAFVFLALFLAALKKADSVRSVVLICIAFSIFYFGSLFAGISELYAYVAAPAYLAWFGLVMLQAVFIMIFALIFALIHDLDVSPLMELILTSSAWVVVEWLRGLGPFGIGGGDLGYSLAGVTVLAQAASLFGVYGVSFLVISVNVLILQIHERRGAFLERVRGLAPSVLFVTAVILAFVMFGVNRLYLHGTPSGKPVNVALIQPNISQLEKLDMGAKRDLLSRHMRITMEILGAGPDIVIWPETVLRTYFAYDREVRDAMLGVIRAYRSYFVVGFPHYEPPHVYNSAFAISPSGEVLGRYDKQRPVPFGEYIPLRPILQPVLRRFGTYFDLFEQGYDANPRPALLRLPSCDIGVAICFESTIPSLMRERARMGANLFVVITNDAWFGRSSLAFQHLDMGVFRAIESGIPLVQVANTGPSAVVNGRGEVVTVLRFGREMAAIAAVVPKAPDTFYCRYGDVLSLALGGLVLAAFAVKLLSVRGFM